MFHSVGSMFPKFRPGICRPVALFLFVAVAFVTVGRAPGAVQLRLREIETLILAEGKSGRDLKTKLAWLQRGLTGPAG